MPVVPAAIVCACTVPSISSKSSNDNTGSQIKAASKALSEADDCIKKILKNYEEIDETLNKILKVTDKSKEQNG